MIVHLDHPNAQQVRRVAIALGDLVHEVVFVGGQMVPFFITDRGLHRMRPTDDVDVVVECRTRQAYHEFAQRLHAVGFRVDQSPGAPVCRYRTTEGLVLDAMPLDGEILGFSNHWYPVVMDTAVSVDLNAGVVIRTAHPAALLATKWEAFLDRGYEDPFGSHDLEDLLMLIAGRPELANEIQPLPMDVRVFIANWELLKRAPSFRRGSSKRRARADRPFCQNRQATWQESQFGASVERPRVTLDQKVPGSKPGGAIANAAVIYVIGGVCVFRVNGLIPGSSESETSAPTQASDLGSTVALDTSGKSAGRRIERTERSTSSCGQ